MKIWRLVDPRDPSFAAASWRGAWSDGKLCAGCTSSSERRIKPLIIEWEPGSDLIGDFTCTADCDGFMIKEDVLQKLLDQFSGFEPGPVEMIQDRKLKFPKQPKRARPRIWLPYTGPPLYELWITKYVHFDRDRTTAKLVRKCSICPYERYELSGTEELEWEWDPKRADLCYRRIRRKPGKGLFVRLSDLAGAELFCVYEFGWVFCTDRFKQCVEECAFTNLAFSEVGDVI